MIYGLYLSTAGAKAQSQRQEFLANNIANVNSTGYKQQIARLTQRTDHLTEFGGPPPHGVDDPRHMGGGVQLLDAPTDFRTQGVMQFTGRSLNVAINGEGFFQVRRGQDTYLTRNGAFGLTASGQLTTADGDGVILSREGNPIQIEPLAEFHIDTQGNVVQNGASVAQLGFVIPSQLNDMQRIGESLYATTAELRDARGVIEQYFLEGSNVNPITQMTELMEAARAFEINLQMVQLQSDSLSRLISTVPAPA